MDQTSQARTLVRRPNSDAPAETAAETGGSPPLWRAMGFIGYAAFITTLAQDKVLGNYPLKFLLKNHMHLSRTDIAAFWFAAGLAWYFKPLAGLVVDSLPIAGTRRRSYMILSSLLGGVLWLMFNVVPQTRSAYLCVDIGLGVCMVFGSTIMGALLVEAGQKYGATGRVSALREIVQSSCGFIAGPVGGWLSTKAFGLTAGIAATLLFSLSAVAFFMLKEPAVAERDTQVWKTAGRQLDRIFASRTLWSAVLLITLYFIAPGLGTTLLFYEQDTLKFSQTFIGSLEAWGAPSAMLGAFCYGFLARRFPLRTLLAVAIFISAASSLSLFLLHDQVSAIAITVVTAFFGTLGVLPLFDLATRATPKGGEAMGYAMMMSVRNLALFGSDWIGSWLVEHHLKLGSLVTLPKFTIFNLVWLNAGTTLITLLAIPLLPRAIVGRKEGQPDPAIEAERAADVPEALGASPAPIAMAAAEADMAQQDPPPTP